MSTLEYSVQQVDVLRHPCHCVLVLIFLHYYRKDSLFLRFVCVKKQMHANSRWLHPRYHGTLWVAGSVAINAITDVLEHGTSVQ